MVIELVKVDQALPFRQSFPFKEDATIYHFANTADARPGWRNNLGPLPNEVEDSERVQVSATRRKN